MRNVPNQGIELNPNLKKRGMKFAHINIATLPGHYADIDVFAVTESCLDCTKPDSQICPLEYDCYRKDRNRSAGGCGVFIKSKWPSKRKIDLES